MHAVRRYALACEQQGKDAPFIVPDVKHIAPEFSFADFGEVLYFPCKLAEQLIRPRPHLGYEEKEE